MDKLEWIRTLKPGDTVCDCRFRHAPIKTIKFDRASRDWVRKILWLLPNLVADRIQLGLWGRKVWGFTSVIDAEIEIDDGWHCSARHCCDPIDTHTLADHPPSNT